ncbi:glycosyltransferase family 2 protein [Candidatus Woesearchaeota archaeon]|nr:glycosyltransferase family 2 protein [Candidatus Woesearchaeota archaeon]
MQGCLTLESKDYVIKNPKLSILMPAYNEERSIEKILAKIDAVPLEKHGISRELIIVDDGSKDRTVEIVQGLMKRYPYIKFIIHKKNRGKGGAIKTAIKAAAGHIMIVQDADLEYDPMDYFRCIMPILKGKAKVVYGSRRLEKSNKQHSHFSFYVGGVVITMIFNMLFFTNITDEPTCYKTFRSDVIRKIRIREDRFNWEPEVTAKIVRRGITIKEVPIRYYPRTQKEGKKIRWKDGLEAIWAMLKYRFVD